MFPCLDNVVGLRGLPQPQPAYDYYVNDLPGLSDELVKNLLSADASAVTTFWAVLLRRAGLRLLSGVEQGLTASKDWTRLVGETGRPVPDSPRQLPVPPASLTGVVLTVGDPDRLDVLLESIYVFLGGSQPVEFGFACLDLGDGQPAELQTRSGTPTMPLASLTLQPGYNEFALDAFIIPRYQEAVIFVGFDTSIDLLTGLPPTAGLLQFADTYPENLRGAVDLAPALLTAPEFTEYSPWTYQVHAKISVQCSSVKIVCDYAGLFTNAWLLLLGVEVLRDKLNSDNANWFTLSNRTQTEANLADLQQQYATALAQALKRLPVSVACVYCDPEQAGKVTYETGNMP